MAFFVGFPQLSFSWYAKANVAEHAVVMGDYLILFRTVCRSALIKGLAEIAEAKAAINSLTAGAR